MKRSIQFTFLLCFGLALAGAVRAQDAQPRPRPDQSAPTPIPAVRDLIDTADRAARERRAAEALTAAEQAVAAARTANDLTSLAVAQRTLGFRLGEAGRPGEALTAWREAGTSWKSLEDGAGQVESLARQALYLFRDNEAGAQMALDEAVRLGLAEVGQARPVAAAAALNAAAIEYYRIGRVVSARQAWVGALEIHKKLADGSLEVARLQNNVGASMRLLGDLEGARTQFQESHRIRQRWAPGTLEEAESLHNLGMVSRDMGLLPDAQKFLQEASLIQTRLAPGSLLIASTLHNAGSVLRDQGDLAGARASHQQALEIRRSQAPGSLEESASLDKLAALLRDEGDYRAGRELALQALQIRERVAPASLTYAECLNTVGSCELGLGDVVSAQARFDQALALQQQLAPGGLDLATTYNNQGEAAYRRSDLSRARSLHEKALALQEQRTPNSPVIAITLGYLGRIAYRQGDWAAAKAAHTRALALQQKVAPESLDVASSYHNLAVVAQEEGDNDKSAEFFTKALAIQERLAPNSEKVAATLANLGAVVHEQEAENKAARVVQAKTHYEKALAIQKQRAPLSLAVAACLNNLGAAAQYEGDLQMARKHYTDAVAILEKISPESLDLVTSLDNLGKLEHQERRLDNAIMYAERVWKIIRDQSQSIVGDEARQAFSRSFGRYSTRLVRYRVENRQADLAFAALEDGRAQSLLQLMLERGLGPNQVDPALWGQYEFAVHERGRAYEALTRAREADLRNSTEATRQARVATEAADVQARTRVQGLLGQLRQVAPAYFGAAMEPAQARAALEPGVVMLAYSIPVSAEDRSAVLFVIPSPETNRRIQAFQLSTNLLELRTSITSINADLQAARSTPGARASRLVQRAQGTIRRLTEEIIPGTARPAILGARHVVISPDGPLWDFPFAAAIISPEGTPTQYLGLQKPLAYAPSLTTYARATQGIPSRSGSPVALVAGDPELPMGDSVQVGERGLLFHKGNLPRLPNAAQEAAEVARLYGVQPLTGAAATESAIRAEMEKADLIHLATHGLLRPQRAMSSGLILGSSSAGQAGSSTDGALLAWEIQGQLRLKADLAVLSACETARGTKVHGEGLIGLSRAFQAAGARSVIASQWQVADESTALLMRTLHQELRQGAAKDEALRRAMAAVEKNPSFSSPYFWAPFLLIGDPYNRVLSAR